MSEIIQLNNANSSTIIQETEDGEIEDYTSNSFESNGNNQEIDDYYIKLKNIGTNLRCACCEEVYSDPVKLNCDHLIDRYCLSTKLKSNALMCPVCQKNTHCDDIDELLTDFDIAAQIPPKPNALIELINKGHAATFKRLKLEGGKETDISDDSGYDLVNGVRIKREKSQKRRRKTRWSAIDDGNRTSATTTGESSHSGSDAQATFTGVISDMLASHNVPKNITISQFKRYTEMSSQADVMNLLTEAVMQNARTDPTHLSAGSGADRRSHAMSDKDVADMIPVSEMEDLFELERVQLVLLYREALDKGVLLLPSQTTTKSPVSASSSSKQALLPTPKTSSKSSVKSSHGKSSPTSSTRKRYTSESSKSSNISYRSSIKSLIDSSDSESASDLHNRLHKRAKHRKTDRKSTTTAKTLSSSPLATATKTALSTPNNTTSSSKAPATSDTTTPQQPTVSSNSATNTSSINSNSTNANNSQNTPSSTSENVQVNSINSKAANDCQKKMCDSLRYREDINRLHTLYSTMYHASLKMKDFENKVDSDDYQASYRTYCDNYTEYQHLYSRLQSAINIDSINDTDNPHLISNSHSNDCHATAAAATTSDTVTPLVNGAINVNVSAASTTNSSTNHNNNNSNSNNNNNNQEQASSTISPAFYAPDSTDSIADSKAATQATGASRAPVGSYPHSNSDIKANIQNNLSSYRQFKKENSLESKKKFGYLWVSNLSKEIRTGDLCKVFGKFGHISKVKLFQYKAQVPPTYFGLIFMPNYGEAEAAVSQLQNKLVNDRQMQIKMLCPNSDSISKTN